MAQNSTFKKVRSCHHFMANRETMENGDRLYLLGSKITADGDWSHDSKRCLLLRRKTMINLDSILKSRDITLPQSPVMYGCESWTIEKVEHHYGVGEDSWEPLRQKGYQTSQS